MPTELSNRSPAASRSSSSGLSSTHPAIPTEIGTGGGSSSISSSRSHDGNNNRGDGDGSKARRHMHLQIGPIVISGAAIDRVRARVVSFTSKLTMDTLRPLPLFLGLTNPSSALCIAADAFSPPISSLHLDKSTREKFHSRMSRNLAYFATNYAFLTMGTILVVALMHPGMLLYVCITWGLWYLHVIVIREDVRLVIMEKDLNDVLNAKRRSYILTFWTAWVAIGKCLKPLVMGLVISGGIVLFHAVMRDPKKLAADIVGSSRAVVAQGSADSDDESEVLVERPEERPDPV